jgi:ubiquitin-protein ligase
MDEDDIYRWNLALIVLNPDSLYYGGYFKAQINFPRDYPYKPPGKSYHFGIYSTWLTPRRFSLHKNAMASQYLL